MQLEQQLSIATAQTAAQILLVQVTRAHEDEAFVRGFGGCAASHVEGTGTGHAFLAILPRRPWVVVTVPALVLCARL